jgi:predicted AAA+ superfamily ATPase
MLENIVYCELRRRKHELYFHKQNQECDFIIKKELEIIQAIQVCLSLENPDTKKREVKGLLEAMRTYKLKQGIILTYSEEGQEIIIDEDTQYSIEIIPVWKWML